MPLDLVIPDLLVPEAPLRMPALERWLARAETATLPAGDMTRALAAAYGLPDPPPVAAITLAGEGRPDVRSWLRADPVHMRVGQDSVSLHDASVLDVSRDEATLLTAELQGLFDSDGFEFAAPSPDRWYVRVPDAEVPVTVPLDDVHGRDVFGLLPRGRGRVNWPSAITEVQMLFSGHPVNARRESEGRPAINGVWFWGEGHMPGTLTSPYALVHADDVFARGLAIHSGTRVVPVPSNAGGIDAVRANESVLVVLDSLRAPRRRGDLARWQAAAGSMDEAWFVPLKEALERFEGVNVILPRGRDTLVARLSPRSRWRFFRRGKPLSAHA